MGELTLFGDAFSANPSSAPVLANELVEAQGSHSLIKLQRRLSKLDLPILDDLSYLSFSKQQSELLVLNFIIYFNLMV